ncbi:MAG: hypothetical protein FWG46_06100 [Treponema sp.]|nr:hypothetical protein [Treponema sp.]
MKKYRPIFLCAALLLAACAGQKNKIIFRPDPSQDEHYGRTNTFESWQIIESESGPGERGIPEWVRRYLAGDGRGIELMDQFSGKYIFVGENQGDNINSLRQWANGFTAAYDLPRLVAARVERRLVSSAALYPDDEYGQYFENLIKKVSDGEYPGAVKEQTYWVRRMRIIGEDDGGGEIDRITELYEYMVLTSIDIETLRAQLRQIMAGIRTATPPTRDQAAAISRIQQTFFEGF